ncbi:hypothetical protein CXB51_020166 [Gossypium anomalum]|uniref:DUF7745 domain-containing protein n=1 Tax=Gossypium anomalum TaxID=47600 RepID=A0A8J5YUC3_9ROSI|nr:hypothetical protein CXB51_020166 [Gossypium anomalum]
MENESLDKVEDNAAIRIRFKKTRLEKCDSLTERFRRPDVGAFGRKEKVDIFALSIYGLVIFLKVLGHIDGLVSGLFDLFDKRVTPVPAILAETFRSLNACRRRGEGKFIGCVTSNFIATFGGQRRVLIEYSWITTLYWKN